MLAEALHTLCSPNLGRIIFVTPEYTDTNSAMDHFTNKFSASTGNRAVAWKKALKTLTNSLILQTGTGHCPNISECPNAGKAGKHGRLKTFFLADRRISNFP